MFGLMPRIVKHMEGNQDEGSLSFEGIWGEDAEMQMPPVGLEFRVQVAPAFYLGPFLRAVSQRQGEFGDKAVQEFCTWALGRHFDAYKGRRSPIELRRKALLSKAVPARPVRGRGHTLVASLDSRIRDETVARLLDARYQGFEKLKPLMFREALFDAVQQVLREPASGGEAEDLREPVGNLETGEGVDGGPSFEEE